MSGYPSVTGKKLFKELIRRGYIYCHTRGSHKTIRHPKDKFIIGTIPQYTKDLGKDLLEDIRKQLKLSKQEFLNILKDC